MLCLFDLTVTFTALYGCEAWTLQATMKRRLRAVQRKMLRMGLASRRRLTRADGAAASTLENHAIDAGNQEDEGPDYELEPWSDFLKRVTYQAEERANAAGMQEWLTTWRSEQWKWARKAVTDGSQKWSNTSLYFVALVPKVTYIKKQCSGPGASKEEMDR